MKKEPFNLYCVPNLPGEEWREIKGFPMYQVSNEGRVKRIAHEISYPNMTYTVCRREMLIKQRQNADGYMIVTLKYFDKRKTLRVQRLVADAFIPNPKNLPMVNHRKEKEKWNNSVENLMWASARVNANWGTRNDRIAEKNKSREFSKQHKSNLSKAMMGNKNGVGRKNSIKHNKTISQTHSKAVICGGKIFKNIKQCAETYDINYRTLSHWLNGDRKMPDEYKKMGLQFA